MAAFSIRRAAPDEAAILAGIAQAAKAHWGYSAAQLAAWRDGLSPDSASIASCPTHVAEIDGEIAGFCQLIDSARPAVVEHLWVHPRHMGRGIGRALLDACLRELAAAGGDALDIDSDPHAEGFYLACGAVRVGEIAAPIDGQPDRVRPQLRLAVMRT